MAAGRTGEAVEVDLEGIERKVQRVLATPSELLPMTNRCSHSLRFPNKPALLTDLCWPIQSLTPKAFH